MTSRVLWVQLQHGAMGEARLRAAASPPLVANIERGFVKSKWYPFEQFVELNVAIDKIFGSGDLSLVKQLGRFGADANLTTIYRLFLKVGSPTWILGRSLRLYSAHYDTGWAEVAMSGPTAAMLRIHAVHKPHRAHCLSVAGWAERSIELSGGREPVAIESRCRTRGDEVCELDVSWRE